MAFTVTLYIMTSGDDYLNKTLTGSIDVSCEFKQPVDVERPIIFISGGSSYDGYNYAYIPEFGRYYYIKPISGNGNSITFEGLSDPLMSFKDQIKACPAVVSRNPWHFDLYLRDDNLPIEERSMSAVINFPNTTIFNGSTNSFILTCLGSGVSVPIPNP